MTNTVYHGELSCSGTTASGSDCRNKAYYLSKKQYLCGVHSRNDSKRKELPKLSKTKKDSMNKDKYRKQKKQIKAARRANAEEGLPGNVVCSKLHMMRVPEDIKGYLKVFPNNKHGGRKDGWGCPEFSPMRLGPVIHNQPGLEDARTIEGYHQGNKKFSFETKKMFRKGRREMYEAKKPSRHKYARKYLKSQGYTNAPDYSIHWDGESWRKYTYLESRYFYCHQYELLTKDMKSLKKLRRKRESGTNIQIIGYDGKDVGTSRRKLWKAYLDTDTPFGHELVLMTLIVLENPDDYPWNRFHRENREIYPPDDIVTSDSDDESESDDDNGDY